MTEWGILEEGAHKQRYCIYTIHAHKLLGTAYIQLDECLQHCG